ncbi:SLAM family member 5-like [Pholidichthys leucotaenia]
MGGGGRLCGLRCFFTYSILLFFGDFLHDVTLAEKSVVHGQVGGIVKLLPNVSTNVTSAKWKYGDATVADADGSFSTSQFTGRSELDPKNFALTIRDLTLGDSGDFWFIYEVNDKQQPTIFITLQVHEPITQQPSLKVLNVSQDALNQSCTVWLECKATGNVSYSWTVGNKRQTGPWLEYSISGMGTKINVTCTVSNPVSEESIFRQMGCDDSFHKKDPIAEEKEENLVFIIGVVGGIVAIVIMIGIVAIVYYCKKRRAGSDTDDITVYADINEFVTEDVTTKPCSLYETIENRTNTVRPGPQTVYDKIQFNRTRKLSSPYQDVS